MRLGRKIFKTITITLLFGVLTFIYICLQGAAKPEAIVAQAERVAVASVQPTSADSTARGQVSLTEISEGLRIDARIEGISAGEYGIHIHEAGSCADGGNAAKGHFNPNQTKHGKLLTDGFANAHAGDLGNIAIGENGIGELSQTLPELALSTGKYSVANLAIILHSQRDDFGQPTGNAGGRIGCGIITLNP